MSKKELEQYKDEIIALYVNGMMQKDIANMFNTSKSSIGRFLRSYNVFGRTKLTLDDKDDIVSLYKSGNTINEFGCCSAQKFNIDLSRLAIRGFIS
jgi:transposase